MVIHDSDQQQRWAEQQQQMRQRKPEKKRGPLSVTAVQSLACCCILLLALLFRLAGGDAYEGLRQTFYKAMQGNEWVSALAGLLDDTSPNDVSAPKSDDKADGFTPSSTLQTQGGSATTPFISDA